jgi:putative membrane protein
MHLAADLFVALIALEHVYILVLEMFLWQTRRGLRVFGMTPEKAELTASLAKNQGLYNGFLAAGLLFGLLGPLAPVEAYHFKLFFVACVLVAGIYGGITAFRKILFMQGGPAAAALVLLLVAGPR